MSPRACIASLAASVVAGVVGVYLILIWPVHDVHLRGPEPPVARGIAGAPSNRLELAGRYVQGDSTDATYLTLLSNGTYSAEWKTHGGNCGEAAGSWNVFGTQLALSPTKETAMMTDLLRSMDIYQFKSNWILVGAADRETYQKFGLSEIPLNYFQKEDTR